MTNFQDKSTSPPPPEFCSGLQCLQNLQPSLQEIDHIVQPAGDLENCERQGREGRVITENILKKEKTQKISAQKENRIPINTNKRLLNTESGHCVGGGGEGGIPQESLTPRSKSKFEHLIRNLRESNDDEQLVLYKVINSPSPTPKLVNKLRITDVVPYKGEPKVVAEQISVISDQFTDCCSGQIQRRVPLEHRSCQLRRIRELSEQT